MNGVPGFTAEASLYTSTRVYHEQSSPMRNSNRQVLPQFFSCLYEAALSYPACRAYGAPQGMNCEQYVDREFRRCLGG
jgi:hypothetical protein